LLEACGFVTFFEGGNEVRNCLLKEVTEGKIQGQKEVTRRRGRRRKQLLDDPGDRRRKL
jgi:hypothetical protein